MKLINGMSILSVRQNLSGRVQLLVFELLINEKIPMSNKIVSNRLDTDYIITYKSLESLMNKGILNKVKNKLGRFVYSINYGGE